MSESIETWQIQNDQYLSTAMEWVRLKLTAAIADLSGENISSQEKTNRDFVIKSAMLQLNHFEASDGLPALGFIKTRFGLSDFEFQLFILCIAVELDTRIPGLCAKAHDDVNKPYPTFALAMSVFDNPSWDVLAPQRPLRFWKLIEPNRLLSQALISAPLHTDERLVAFVKGLNYLDERIIKITGPFSINTKELQLPVSQQDTVAEAIKNIQASNNSQPVTTQLVGSDNLSKQLVANAVASELNLHLVCIPFELLPTQLSELEELARLWNRESQMLRIAGYIDGHSSDAFIKANASAHGTGFLLQRFLSISQGIFLVSVREVCTDISSSSLAIEVKKPSAIEQREEWQQLLGDKLNGSAALLSGQFNLNIASIRQIVSRSNIQEADEKINVQEKVWHHCLLNTSPELDTLVQRLDLKAKWKDLVLPAASEQQLRQIASQVKNRSVVYDNWGFREKMNRGLGINALFIGESGTGKTMAAEVLANELGLHLYRIDLSGVVSKYIGETEKNLRRVFDAAEDGGAILFFDEADALFGKRSEVKDSHDRYANIEINYLLQRMESFNGLAILATNKKNALDEAFIRRLRFIVYFPFPGTKERKAIAERVFPEVMPKGYLDYDRLASLNLTGGSLHNIAINAAFKAADEGSAVTMQMVLSAARAEFQKMERPVKESDFIWNE